MSSRTLIIVESPAKCHTISRYVGEDFQVLSSMGHIRDLPPSVLGIDVNQKYKPCYVILPEKKKIIEELKRGAKKATQILLASDPDREGEAIAFHLRELLKETNGEISRILFNEITKPAILNAIENPTEIDMHKVESQQMRRLLDRLAGYKISPVLHQKIGGPLSAGRVQSVALKLIVEREKEIRAFTPEEYWTVEAELEGSVPPKFRAKLEKKQNKALSIPNQEECDGILKELKENSFLLDQIKKKRKKRKAPPPLITSSLQQEAFRKFKFPIKKTMQIAQELYEGVSIGSGETTGLITYMRSDSLRISPQALNEGRQFLQTAYGNAYVPEKANFFRSKGKSQDAHECIRPTFPFHPPEEVKGYLSPNQLKIYQLIWNRFFASQMADADIQETQFLIKNGDYLFSTKGETVVFDGFMAVLKSETQETFLPDLKEKEILRHIRTESKQNFTKPPARYTEASLVKILEEKGIGRPSTYAKIIDILGKRDYVFQEEKKFVPSDLGIRVVEYLDENFSELMNYDFTADLEKELDLVSEGKLDWVDGIDRFYKQLQQRLEAVKKGEKISLPIGRPCPRCQSDLIKKYSRKTKGWFIGCSGYPQCTYTERLIENGQEAPKSEPVDKACPTCGKPLVRRYSKKTRNYFIGCSGYPQCTYIESQDQNLGECPQCQKPLRRMFSRKTRRYFIGCSGYPDCTYIQKKK